MCACWLLLSLIRCDDLKLQFNKLFGIANFADLTIIPLSVLIRLERTHNGVYGIHAIQYSPKMAL